MGLVGCEGVIQRRGFRCLLHTDLHLLTLRFELNSEKVGLPYSALDPRRGGSPVQTWGRCLRTSLSHRAAGPERAGPGPGQGRPVTLGSRPERGERCGPSGGGSRPLTPRLCVWGGGAWAEATVRTATAANVEQPPSTDNAKGRESISGSKRPLRLRFPPLGRGLPDCLKRGCWKTRSKSQFRTTQRLLKEGNQVSFKQLRVRSFSGKRAPAPPGRGPRRRRFLSGEGRRPRRGVSPPGREVQGPLPSLRPPPWPPSSPLWLWTAQGRAPDPMRRAKSAPKMGWEENAPTLVPPTLAARHVLHLFPPPCLSASRVPRPPPPAPRSAAGQNCLEGLPLRRGSPRGSGHSPARGSPPVLCGGTAATPPQSSRSGRAATSRVTRGCPPPTHSGDDLRRRPPQPNRAFGRQPAASQPLDWALFKARGARPTPSSHASAVSVLPRLGLLSAPLTCLAGAPFSGTRPLPPAPDPAPVPSPMAPPVPTPRPGVPGYLQRGGRGRPSRRRRGTCARPNGLGVRRPRAAAAPSPLPAFSRRRSHRQAGPSCS